MKRLIIISIVCCGIIKALAQSNEVLYTARLANDYLMAKHSDPTLPTNVKRIRPSSLWTRAVYYEGLMALYAIDQQQRYIDYALRWADFHQWTPRNGVATTNADDQCCSQTYIELNQLTGKGTLEYVRENLQKQMASQRTDYWTWIDAIQMAMPVYVKMYAITGDKQYLDYAMKSYRWTRNQCGGGCLNVKEGLWWRDANYVAPYQEKDGKNCYWSRGNGWVYAALVRSMSLLPKKSREYQTLRKDFLLMSKALLDCQHQDGFWHASLLSDVEYPHPEMTGTALFLYGMAWGIQHGLLNEKEYRLACNKAWQALKSCIHENGFLGWNQGTGKDPSAGQPVTFTSVPDFEDYGTGCYLLGLTEYYKLLTSSWPTPRPEAKAGTRWWWLGSAVDKENLEWNLSEYARAGIGAVEITPLYGVQGNDKNNISFLSPQWMEALKTVQDIAKPLGIEVDMNCGTGWPFGGPHISLEQAACKAVFKDSIVNGKNVYQIEIGRTKQKVKRAAPGGEGWVVDHFDREAVRHYLDRFEKAFAESRVPYPHTFFNDSYEVYKANWTPKLFDEFKKRRGYDLRHKLPELLGVIDDGNQVLCDYRETLSDLLYENFTLQWVDWAHRHGVKVRNQAHGSPANLLDLYAAVDIPEIEGFGLSEFGIKGLRTDSGMTRKNFSDVSMLKYASSAAHVMGKPFTSSETFTWLTEHFRTSLSQMKPDLDLMFTCGVNHVYFHGSCYTPKDDPWPGWKFYASVDMSPTNSIWRDAPYMMKYIERCQSFLQKGQPDNDFLVYLPIRDMWRQRGPRNDDAKWESKNRRGGEDLLMQFDIHTMDEKAPQFIKSILAIDSLGYDCDYISDRQLSKVKVENGMLVTEGGTRYRALIIPQGTTIDNRLQALIEPLESYTIIGEAPEEMSRFAKPEPMKTKLGLRAIRRKSNGDWHYFIANLTPHDISSDIALAVPFKSATWYNPMNGDITPAYVQNGKLHIALRSGESRILQTSTQPAQDNIPKAQQSQQLVLQGPWKLTFMEESPHVLGTFTMPQPQTWESFCDSAAVTMGTGVYSTTFHLTKEQAKQHWMIELGDVRESARVYLNGEFIGCAWAVPFTLDCRHALHKGNNELRIEVTNLPANRIADMDRKGIKWRKFNEINVVDINYKKTTYEGWKPVKSGLNSEVKLVCISDNAPLQKRQYKPGDAGDFICVDGNNRYTRALYGSHTDWRLETSDCPIFAVVKKGYHRNIRFVIEIDGKNYPMEDIKPCKASYQNGQRTYLLDIKDGDKLNIKVIAMPDSEAAVWKFYSKELKGRARIKALVSEIAHPKLNRNGDIGADKPGSLEPKDEVLQMVELALDDTTAYMKVDLNVMYSLNNDEGRQLLETAEKHFSTLSQRIKFNTPDPYINTLGSALVIAADGDWDGKTWLHGCIGWRMPLAGWRAGYLGDVMGWNDRAISHFNAYAKSQVTQVPPTISHPSQDADLNIARAEKKWGTQMYSNGYICRNPERNDQMHHYDMNLNYIDELLWHFQYDADTAYMRKMWPVLTRHLAWEKRNFDPDGDHLYDAYCCIWASDALYYSGGAVTHSSAYNYRGNKLAARIAEMIGEDPQPYHHEAEAILKAMNEHLWLKDKGVWAEYQDALGLKRKHDHPAVWSVYTPIDCGACSPEQAYRATQYIDKHIPHIDVEETGYQTIATSDWMPYSWSINNVAAAEVMHTALAYYEAGRAKEGYQLMKANILDQMYYGQSPANFGQISQYDANRGECYRDFGDCIGISSRTLIQGLFGIIPQALYGKCIIRPGFPSEWEHASVEMPYLKYHYSHKGNKIRLEITQSFNQPLQILVRQNTKLGEYHEIQGTDEHYQVIEYEMEPVLLSQIETNCTDYVDAEKLGLGEPEQTKRFHTVDLSRYYNSEVSDIFKNKYLSPRPKTTTLQIPIQGIGEWCHPLKTVDINDSVFRSMISNGIFMMAGVPMRTPSQGRNIIYTSLWDYYPDSIEIPLKGKAERAYLLMAGSTNHMQSRIDNGLVVVTYTDGTTDTLALKNPDNWCPIEQDYYIDNKAFRAVMPRPYRVCFSTGDVTRTLDNAVTLQGEYGREIPGGAGQMLVMPLNPKKHLKSLMLRTLSNDVVIGLMSLTLQ